MTFEYKSENCCVCGENQELCTECPYNHIICKNCYLSVLQICYCKNKLGNVVYRCPLCRNEHILENKDMNSILLNLINSEYICLKVHKLCEYKELTKKCQFKKCGCRKNIVDIMPQEEDLDLAIKEIIHIANNYN